jgi:hypothetical protein
VKGIQERSSIGSTVSMSWRVTKASGLQARAMRSASRARLRGRMLKARRTSPSRPSAFTTVTPKPALRRSSATWGLPTGASTRIMVAPTASRDSSVAPK